MVADFLQSLRLTSEFSPRGRPLAKAFGVQRKVDELGARLGTFPHKRLEDRPEFKLRVGDYRVIYEFDLSQGRIYLHYVGHRRDIYKRR